MGRNALVKMIANLRKTKPKGRPAPTSDTRTRKYRELQRRALRVAR
jgi:hypothetical protein